MTAADIIAKLGGYRAVAEHLGCAPSQPNRWQRDGIPARRVRQIVEMARAKGVAEVDERAVLAACAGAEAA